MNWKIIMFIIVPYFKVTEVGPCDRVVLSATSSGDYIIHQDSLFQESVIVLPRKDNK